MPDAGDTARYGLAILATIAALLLRALLQPFYGAENPYHTVWLAVMFAAWYCGTSPSIVAVLLGGLGIWYWFLPPTRSFGFKSQPEVLGMAGFFLLSAIIVSLGAANRRAV
ncbi:MAG: DUF4118 domain-containing protein, partial [Acidobacteriales bacterium]|nr:DUF4118 domain-containing protein [Terriglobales bacterium]